MRIKPDRIQKPKREFHMVQTGNEGIRRREEYKRESKINQLLRAWYEKKGINKYKIQEDRQLLEIPKLA